jgi:hypothetical protein
MSQEDDGQQGAPGETDRSTDARSGAPGIHDVDPAVLELESVFSVLSHARRRYLLYALTENPEWTLTDLATKLAAWEADIDESTVERRRRDRTYISLVHTHVPKLVDEGVVAFDEATETIAPGPHAEQVFVVLAGVGTSTDSAQERHAGRSYESSPEEPDDGEP